MDRAEFDRFADEYRALHAANIQASGESPEFFAEYKIADVAMLLADRSFVNGPAVLDFGAGIGTSVPYFRKYFPNCRLTCLDVSQKSLDVGRERYPGQAHFVHFDGGGVPFPDDHFDLVFFACVLHHIAHAEHSTILKEARRVLRPGGALVVYEHNPYNPLTVRAVETCAFDENAVLVRPGGLRRSASAAGFERPVVRYRVFFPHALRGLRWLEPALTWLPFGAQYYLHARKG